MKSKLLSWRIVLMSIIAAVCACISACSDEPTPQPEPTPDPKENGEVSFTIDLPQGSGDGSSASPAVVESGAPLNMAISQKSSYTDPDGSVFTCEPKAVIQLSAKMDTVHAKDIENLTAVKEGSDVKTSKTGTSPVRNQTLQTFEIGGQNIVFDLSHEIYTYVSSTKEKIEMPYILLNQARLGGSNVTEETAKSRSAVIMTGVTVRPLVKSRATTVTDSTMYEVNVRFSLDIESKNSKSDTKQTLEFLVTYVGVVETVTELKDPVAEVSYVWDVKNGTTSTSSPFVKTSGEKTMEVWMAQSCSYTDEYGNQAVGEPKAKIKLSVAQDTIWAKTLNELKTFAEKTEEKPSGQSATQKFGSALQSVDIEWSYEVGEANLAGTVVPMPFYSLTPVKLKDVSLKDVSENATVYEITATFSQKAVAENVKTEASEVEVEYVVSYIGTVLTDPVSDISYAWEVKSGTKSKDSPFVKTKGDVMELWMAQTSSYVDEYGNRATCKPTAKIKLSAERDTVWAKTLDELKTFAEKTDGKPSGQSATQKFGSTLQNVDVEWSYEKGEAELDGQKISMPFYSLTPVTLKDISVKEVSDDIINDKMVSLYEVIATLSQKAVAENVTSQTSEIEIEYVVSYVGALEVSLVKVEYYPDGIWIDPHDNMELNFYARVDRYRTYSNGKRLGPDEFYDFGHPTRPYAGSGDVKEKIEWEDGTWYIGFPSTTTNEGDSIIVTTEDYQISTLGDIRFEEKALEESSVVPFKDWDNYRFLSRPIDDSYSLAKDFDNPDYPKDNRASGWYFDSASFNKYYFPQWKPADEFFYTFGYLNCCFRLIDQFLVIDGRRIDFSEFHNLKMNFSFSENYFEDAHRKGTVAKLEMHATYLGKNFYATHIKNIYVAK